MQKSKKYAQAVRALQYAIRGTPTEVDCWLQLAIAYRELGKHVAALKTLGRVNELDPSNWHARYLIGDIQRQLGLFEASLRTLSSVQHDMPDELVVKVAIAETYLSLAFSEARAGFTRRAVTTLLVCIRASVQFIEGVNGSRIAWKLVGDALSKLAELVTEEEEELRSILSDLFEKLSTEKIDSKDPLLNVIAPSQLRDCLTAFDMPTACLAISVLSNSFRLLLESQEDDSAGSAWFDLGYALYRLQPHSLALGLSLTEENLNTQSFQCLRNALHREPLNGTFWNLLGVLAIESSPKLAQHSLIRACELNVRVSFRKDCIICSKSLMPCVQSAVPWTNLGLFYIHHKDLELANKALLRAQVLDPDFAQAWLGQAALASMHGNTAQAGVLTDHAVSLANGTVVSEVGTLLHFT